MTYTREQLDKMRNWVALNVMKYRKVQNGKQPYYEVDDYSIDVEWVEDFKPDTDPSQMFKALDTFDVWICGNDSHGAYCQIVEDGVIKGGAVRKPLGLAALIAMCRASGMPE